MWERRRNKRGPTGNPLGVGILSLLGQMGTGGRMSTTMSLDEVIERRDQVTNTRRNVLDQSLRQEQLRLSTILIHHHTIATLTVGPKLLDPGQTGKKLETVPFDAFRDRLTSLVQTIAMKAVLSIVGGSVTKDEEGTQCCRVTLGPVSSAKRPLCQSGHSDMPRTNIYSSAHSYP